MKGLGSVLGLIGAGIMGYPMFQKFEEERREAERKQLLEMYKSLNESFELYSVFCVISESGLKFDLVDSIFMQASTAMLAGYDLFEWHDTEQDEAWLDIDEGYELRYD